MTKFPELPDDDYPIVRLSETDKALPETLNPRTRYAYFKTIARGGKSLIQSAKDLHLGRAVCYKSLKAEFADDPIEQTRLVREARVSAMLQHPNTVPTYEIGRDSRGRVYFTMKLVHGYTLREILDYRERYDLNQLVDVIVQVAQALDYAHSHGVAHRDIKPENILVGPFGEVLLLDWGLAKVWDPTDKGQSESAAIEVSTLDDLSLTAHGALQGTAAFMSPEQIRRDPNIDYRTDIYSLGAILYEVLTGVALSQGDTFDAILDQTLNQKPASPSDASRVGAVPGRLETICMRCIAKAPDDRYQSAGELVRELREDW